MQASYVAAHGFYNTVHVKVSKITERDMIRNRRLESCTSCCIVFVVLIGKRFNLSLRRKNDQICCKIVVRIILSFTQQL